MRVLVKIASRSRPDALKRVMLEYERLASRSPDTRFLISADKDDPSMADFMNPTRIPCSVHFSTSDSKIHAINRDLESPDWDWAVIGSDDMIPLTQNWDEKIRAEAQRLFPDGDGIIWPQDGYNMRIPTIPIMGRKYYDRFGWVFDPRFKSLYCDDLLKIQSEKLGKIKQTTEIKFQHSHYRNRHRMRDELDKKNESFMKQDYELFRDIVRTIR